MTSITVNAGCKTPAFAAVFIYLFIGDLAAALKINLEVMLINHDATLLKRWQEVMGSWSHQESCSHTALGSFFFVFFLYFHAGLKRKSDFFPKGELIEHLLDMYVWSP